MNRHAAWMLERDEEAPEAITACVRELFEARPDWQGLAHADAFMEASQRLLRRVLEGEAEARSVALDLLAADSCVTWAFEAAADDPGSIAGLAERATDGIAAIAAEFA